MVVCHNLIVTACEVSNALLRRPALLGEAPQQHTLEENRAVRSLGATWKSEAGVAHPPTVGAALQGLQAQVLKSCDPNSQKSLLSVMVNNSPRIVLEESRGMSTLSQ